MTTHSILDLPSMLTADAELPILALCSEIHTVDTVDEPLRERTVLPGPYEADTAYEVKIDSECVTIHLTIKDEDLPTDEIKISETTLADLDEYLSFYGHHVVETIANELGQKPDSVHETVHKGDNVTLTANAAHLDFNNIGDRNDEKSYHTFICKLNTNCFWEIDDLWQSQDR